MDYGDDLDGPAKTDAEPQHDAFTRWWGENMGGLPTPDDVREIKPLWEQSKLNLDEDRYADIVAADLLAQGDSNGGIPPYDPEAEAAAYAKRGIDAWTDPQFVTLAELNKLGRARLEAHERKAPDPNAPNRARSARQEKTLRKAKRKALKASKSCSKVSRRNPLRDEERDRAILAEICGFLGVGIGVRFTPNKRELVSPLFSSPLLPTSITGRSTTHDPVIQLPPWSKASLPLRSMAMGIAAGNQGAADFTLHLGNSGIAYGIGMGEMQFARRTYRKITDALARECPRAGYPAPDLFFLVEKGKGERPHLHGVIFLPPSKTHQRHLRQTLREAMGTDWKPKGRDLTQLEFGAFYEPAGWIKYITKWVELTKNDLGDNIFASSRSITRSGQAWYEDIRSRRGLLLPGKAIPISGVGP